METEILQLRRFRIKGLLASPSKMVHYDVIVTPQEWAGLVPSLFTHFTMFATSEPEPEQESQGESTKKVPIGVSGQAGMGG